jgi:hypothetical protein
MSEQASASAAGTIGIGGDTTVNRLGFGAMRITGRGIWGEPANPEQAKAALRRAVELGVNFIDTADSYGPDVSEELIAETLYPYPDDLVIATKGGQDRAGPDRWQADGRPEHLRDVCDGSLRRLKLEQIPLYQLHRPDPKVPYAESIGALIELKSQGKIRHIGISNVSEDQVRQAQSLTPVASVQNRLQLGGPVVGADHRSLRAGVDRLPALGADARHRQAAAGSERRASAWRQLAPDRACRAAGQVVADTADTRVRVARSCRGQRRRRRSAPDQSGGKRAPRTGLTGERPIAGDSGKERVLSARGAFGSRRRRVPMRASTG